jgi:RHS repeat-associated protein
MIMPGSVVPIPGNQNRNLYNGGSEWQNDYANLPDYYQTFYRNYDAALGRFVGVDPNPESAESMTGYQYAGNSPVMMNDPMGDVAVMGVVQQHAGHEIDDMNQWLDTGGLQGGYGDGLPCRRRGWRSGFSQNKFDNLTAGLFATREWSIKRWYNYY